MLKIEVLGTVQDGGVPHMGCNCELCESAREDCQNQMYVGALMMKECGKEESVRYLIDATPDIRHQVGGDTIDGVFVSHGHLGHIAGLPFFGTEAMDTDDLSVYCTPQMKDYIMSNDPFRLLNDKGQIQLHETEQGETVTVMSGSVEFKEVVHRYVNTDTVSFMIEGPERKVYYLSDIDEWTTEALDDVREADVAIVDGTFYSKDEIDRYEEVPHPCIKKTMEVTEDFDTDIRFIHLNHTNPALREESDERAEIRDKGYEVVERGTEIEL